MAALLACDNSDPGSEHSTWAEDKVFWGSGTWFRRSGEYRIHRHCKAFLFKEVSPVRSSIKPQDKERLPFRWNSFTCKLLTISVTFNQDLRQTPAAQRHINISLAKCLLPVVIVYSFCCCEQLARTVIVAAVRYYKLQQRSQKTLCAFRFYLSCLNGWFFGVFYISEALGNQRVHLKWNIYSMVIGSVSSKSFEHLVYTRWSRIHVTQQCAVTAYLCGFIQRVASSPSAHWFIARH